VSAATRLSWTLVGLLLITNGLGLWMWQQSGRRSSGVATSALVRAELRLPANVTLALGRGAAITLSPDGRIIVVRAQSAGKVQLYLHHLDQLEAAPIPGTDGALDPFLSPDGKSVAFFADGRLKTIPITGGVPVTLAEAPNPRGLTWGEGDVLYLAPRNNTGIWRVPARGGKLEQVTTLEEGELSHRWPQVLPGGTGLLYTVWNDSGWEPGRVMVQSLDGRARRELIKGGGFGRVVSDAAGRSYLVYARETSIYAAPFDVATANVTGAAVTIFDRVATNYSGAAHLTFSTTGTLAYLAGGGEFLRDVTWVTRSGETAPPLGIPLRTFDISPDGSRIAYFRSIEGRRDVWLADLASKTPTRFTNHDDPTSTDAQVLANPPSLAWSPQGTSLAYAAGSPVTNLYVKSLKGDAPPIRLTTSGNYQSPSSWSPDGKTVAYVEFDPLSGADIWVVTLDAEGRPSQPRPFLRTPFSELAPLISPDGRWLAYYSNERGQFDVYLQPFPGGGAPIQVSTATGLFPRWSPNGRELFFRSGPTYTQMSVVSVTTAPQLVVSKPRVLFESRADSIFSVSPDGGRLLMLAAPPTLAAPNSLKLVLNWLGPGSPQ
jgi:Tol biopolymer transport system component